MKNLLKIFLFLAGGSCNGQNLIPNGDFEQYWNCPFRPDQIDLAKDWFQTRLISSSDYYNQCDTSWANVPNTNFGYQQAHSGNAYAGIYTFIPSWLYREYIEVPIKVNSLIANNCYHFEMYINLGNNLKYTSSNIGIYFSDSIISGISTLGNLPFVPQISNSIGNYPDTLHWTLVSGDYFAHGSEKYLVIGNFNSDTSTSNAVLVNPMGNNPATYIYIDDVSLTPCGQVGEKNISGENDVILFPNPLLDELSIKTNVHELIEFTLYNIYLIKIMNLSFRFNAKINTEQLAKGMYLYEIRNKNGIIKKGKLIK